jgi:hypothetical protein
MFVSDLFQKLPTTKFFVLDSHQDAMGEQEVGHQYDDNDFIGYAYNIHQFNRLTSGSLFLYRRPGKLSNDRKFHIYGGGTIESICSSSAQGDVIAKIGIGFKFAVPINQGDPFIENYTWKTRNKPGPGWKGFWTNYGMNEIMPDDFWGLVHDREIVLFGNQVSSVPTFEENAPIDSNSVGPNYSVSLKTGDANHRNYSTTTPVRKIDFDQLNKRKKSLGTLGELIVLSYERERLRLQGSTHEVVYVADTIGDGLGYDILSFDSSGKELHIEVKTTTANISDNFFMTQREIDDSHDSQSIYKIYRIYNLNEKAMTASLVIYDGPIDASRFQLTPTTFRISAL